MEPDFAAEMALDITTIIEKQSQVDWTHILTIHDRISQDIDDLFYRYQKEKGLFTRDRRPKLGMHFLRQRWAEIPTSGFKE